MTRFSISGRIVLLLLLLVIVITLFRVGWTDKKPLVTHTPVPRRVGPQRNCVVSLMNTPNYLRMAEVLGYSLLKHHVSAMPIMMLTKTTNTPEIVERLEKAGWHTKEVDVIPQPGGKVSATPRFRQMFTKLNIWTLIECDIAIYLDIDTLVLKNFDELFTFLPSDIKFAASPDNVFGWYAFGINAGVFICRPDLNEFKTLLRTSVEKMDKYNSDMVEQAFLSFYYQMTMLRLPLIYNANLAIFKHNREDWDSFADEIKIIHYTLLKPSLEDMSMEPFGLWNETEKEFLSWRNSPPQL
jgi:lipopolysaccharide biosynthesis glycosyltransferase